MTRKIGFILASTYLGTMILNRFDYRMEDPHTAIGVGNSLLESSTYEPQECAIVLEALAERRKTHGDGVVVVDAGANIGCHTVAWAKAMTGWGYVVAVEAQERLYYALAGNIAINNLFNAHAIHAALSDTEGVLRIPMPDYLSPGSFGSLELRQSPDNEPIGQEVDYSNTATIRMTTIDALNLPRVDLLKIDVEGMELEVLRGARGVIERFRPHILVEHIKTPLKDLVSGFGDHGYKWSFHGANILAVHPDSEWLGSSS